MRQDTCRRQSQNIRTKDDLGGGCIKDRQQMGIVGRSDLIMPPALRHIGDLAGRYREIEQFIGEGVDEGNNRCSCNAINKLVRILMNMRFNYIPCGQINIEQRGVAERVQLLNGERVDIVPGILSKIRIIAQIIRELDGWRCIVHVRGYQWRSFLSSTWVFAHSL